MPGLLFLLLQKLEEELHAQLHDARKVSAVDLAKRRAARAKATGISRRIVRPTAAGHSHALQRCPRVGRHVELGMVEDVERLRSELKRRALLDRKMLED